MNLISSVLECLSEAAEMQKIRKGMCSILDREIGLSGTNPKEIITIIWEASGQAIKRDAAIAIASRAIISGVATTSKEFERVVSIATKWAYCIGMDVEQCVDMFVTVAARRSRKLAADWLDLIVEDKALTGSPPGAQTQIFLDDMIRATGWDYARIAVTSGVGA